ncbi:MAG: hypothetical protein LIP03_14690 [Bacteroidales bacterium]|nr:hypothetical protein [Bacteroidales bacterium]
MTNTIQMKMMNDFDLLKTLFAIHSPSGKEYAMRKFIKSYVKRNIPCCKIWGDRFGNLYAVKGKPDCGTYPCVVSHLDQVQPEYPLDYKVISTEDIIFGYSHSTRSMCGLGADDKVGIFICLQCLKRFPSIKAAFFADEERGCHGSEKCELKFFDDARFIIEPDRKGNSDLITQISYTQLASDDFIQAINAEQFGYAPERGLLTDVEALKERGYPRSCINLSCGYYNPHTSEEYVVKKDLLNCMSFVFHIIETVKETYPCDNEDGYLSVYTREDELSELYDMLDFQMSYNPNASAKDYYDYYKHCYPSLKEKDFEEVMEAWRETNEPIN